jgi:hypothetical protein
VFFQRNLVPVVMTGDGVSTYLALIFGTLLSSQGTVASFVLTRETLSRLSSGRFPSVLRFRLYQIFPIRFPRCFPVDRFCFAVSFPAFPTLSEALSRFDRRSFPILSGGSLWNLRSVRPVDTNRCRPDEIQFQATVRIYLPTGTVSTAPAGRRGH